MAKTRIFIAVGSTAISGLTELVSRLKECGIYRNDPKFNDQFIAIDTDITAIDAFRNSGVSKNINGIHIPRTRAAGTPKIPAKDPAKYIAPINGRWSGVDVEVAHDGVFGYRRKSYADLSWVERLKTYIAQTYHVSANPEQAEDDAREYELIFIATSYGGSSSGLLMNVAEVARSCVKPTTASYCLLMLPCESLKTSDGYSEGWSNFLNFWQQFQQATWERKFNRDRYAFPFYAGYMDPMLGRPTENLMSHNLFRIKSNIEDYNPAKTGCYQPFNAVFPLIPNTEAYDPGFHPHAVAELAIFLFYTGAVEQISDNGNADSTINAATNLSERNFVGLKMVGARGSTYGTFYQYALQIFKTECELFLGQDIERIKAASVSTDALLSQMDKQNIQVKYKNILENIKKSLYGDNTADIFKNEIAADKYLELVRRNAQAFPSFKDFIANYDKNAVPADASASWWLKTYKEYYEAVEKKSKCYDSNKKKLLTIYHNIEDVIKNYAKAALSKALNAEESLEKSIQTAATALLVETFEELHKSAVAMAALELYRKPAVNTEADTTSFVEKVSQWVTGKTDFADLSLSWNDIKKQLNLPSSVDESAQRKDMFVRNVIGDISSVCNNYNVKTREVLAHIHGVIAKFMQDVSFDQKGKIKNFNGLQVLFDDAMDKLIADLQTFVSEQRAADANDRFYISVGIDSEQKPFWPKDKTITGKTPVLTYYTKGGTSTDGIDFKVTPLKIREDILKKYGLESYLEIVPNAIGIRDERNPDCELKVNQGTWSANSQTLILGDKSTIEHIDNADTPADMFGVWAGEGKLCMSSKNVLDAYLGINTVIPTNTNLKTLQSRLLFTLHEVVYFGIFLGIVKNKLRKAMSDYSREKNRNVNTTNKLVVSIDIMGNKYSTKQEGISFEEFGYDLNENSGERLKAVPIDMMETLSRLFKRHDIGGTGGTSVFAQALDKIDFNGKTAATLEEEIEQRELGLFNSEMCDGLPADIEKSVDALYEKCEEFVKVEIL